MIGKRISKYTILEKIGRGGMGEVYLAYDEALDRRVALKFLPPELEQDEIATKRFLQEAKAAGSIDHPFICHIHEIGEVQEKHFIAMELVEGMTVQQRLMQGPLPTNQTLRLAAEIAEALEVAHQKGIIHRDLKPSNIMITPQGRAKVMDFGLAKLQSGSDQDGLTAGLTQTGTTLGTLAYMSPEQLRGAEVDTRSDIFSFGLVLYEMLTGAHPFRRQGSVETASAILRDDAPALTQFLDEVPEGLDWTFQKLLAKDSADRFQCIAEMRPHLGESEGFVIPRSRPLPWGRILRLWPGAVLAMALFLAVLYWPSGWTLDRRVAVKEDSNRVAVSIFRNDTGDPDLDSVGRMTSDWVTRELSRSGLVEVVPTGALWEALGNVQEETPGESRDLLAGAQTRAALVVSGGFYSQGEVLHFASQIRKVSDGSVLVALPAVSGNRNEPLGAIQELSERTSGALAATVVPALKQFASEVSTPPKFDAYDEFLKGLDALYLRMDRQRADQHLHRALELDPLFVSSHIFAINADALVGRFDHMPGHIQNAREGEDRLSPYDRALLDSYEARVKGDPMGALRAMRRVVQLWPGRQSTLEWMDASIEANYLDEAWEAFEQNSSNYPEMHQSPDFWDYATRILHMKGDHRQELREAQRGRELLPEAPLVIRREADALAAMGRIPELENLIESLPVGFPLKEHLDLYQSASQELRAHGQLQALDLILTRARQWFDTLSESERHENRGYLGLLSFLEGDWEEARPKLAEQVQQKPMSRKFKTWLAVTEAKLGNRSVALKLRDELQEGTGGPGGMPGLAAYSEAQLYAALGDPQLAISHLKRAFDEGLAYGREIHREIAFETLQDEPAFQELLEPKVSESALP
ncbi:MAG: protein kinase [Acidobacteriota bacterium]|nr:MAG: protein kinase [Acidobacteriota bacterium]